MSEVDMNELVKQCFNIAKKYHSGQVDKGGNPYINHPVSVALKLDNKMEQCVALLHDILEDTELTSVDLLKMNIPQIVVDYIEVLTRKSNESYFNYINRVARYKVTRNVKLADLEHNMDLSRIKNPTQKDIDRLNKYKKYHDYLMSIGSKNDIERER